MEHGFPPEPSAETLRAMWATLHCIMLSLVFCAAGGLVLLRKRPENRGTLWLWTLLVIFAPIVEGFTTGIIGRGLPGDLIRTSMELTISLYVLLVWVICFIGNVATHRTLRHHQRHSELTFAHATMNLFGTLLLFVVLSLPAVNQRHPDAAHRDLCRYNLKRIGIAVHDLLDATGSLPLAQSGDIPVSWRVRLLPYFDPYHKDLFEKYDQKLAWDSTQNEAVARKNATSMTCPTARNRKDERDRWLTHYTMVRGPNTISDAGRARPLRDIPDGWSNTLFAVEAAGLNIVWTEPRDAHIDEQPLGINFTGTGEYDSPGLMSAWHLGGAHAVFADGSTRFLSQDIDPAVLKALTTVDAGDSVEGWDRR